MLAIDAVAAKTENRRTKKARNRTLWGDALRRLLKNKLAVIAFFWIAFIVLVALSADLWVARLFGDPTFLDTTLAATNQRLAPSLEHPFGTDNVGRDAFSLVIYGARVSLAVGIIATGISASVGERGVSLMH